MARNARKQASRETEEIKRTCRECAHCHGWFDRGFNGSMILGYCPYKKEGKFAILLDDRSCANFTERQ